MASEMKVKRNEIQARFGGAGFHNSESGMYCRMGEAHFNQVIAKIFRELSPGFSRMSGGAADWTRRQMDDFAEYCSKMHCVTDTKIYLTGHIRRYETEAEKCEFAEQVAENLDYLINQKGLRGIQFYCMSNELSCDDWSDLFFELPVFKDYQEHLYRAFRRKNLPVKLLATDASPYERWESIEWAVKNGLVPISGVFGGHHYANDFEPQDLDFYKIFQKNVRKVVQSLYPHERRFILGEFGLAQDMRNINGVKMDVCKYFYDGQEAYSALQITEMALAAMNAGVYSMALWTFTDFPNPKGTEFRYNKWGMTKWDGDDHSPRDWLYAYGLLVKFLRQDGKPLNIETSDYLLRSGGVVNDDGSFSIAIVNRRPEAADLTITLEGVRAERPIRQYIYETANVPRNPFGDLQPFSTLVSEESGAVKVTLPGSSVTMLTTDYQDHKPAAVTGVSETEGTVNWQPSADGEHCYYRVYKGADPGFTPSPANQIASTIDTKYVDATGVPGFYQVRSVDRWGNV